MKAKITAFLHSLIMYDYILFGGVFIVFLLVIILAIVLRHKTGLSIFLVLISFAIFFLGPSVGYIQMHKFLFKNEVALQSQKKLEYLKAIVVRGTITNTSKFDFKSCKISASAYKVSGNKIKDFIYQLKPIVTTSIIQEDIKKAQSTDFKIIVEPFGYTKGYSISLGANCK